MKKYLYEVEVFTEVDYKRLLQLDLFLNCGLDSLYTNLYKEMIDKVTNKVEFLSTNLKANFVKGLLREDLSGFFTVTPLIRLEQR